MQPDRKEARQERRNEGSKLRSESLDFKFAKDEGMQFNHPHVLGGVHWLVRRFDSHWVPCRSGLVDTVLLF